MKLLLFALTIFLWGILSQSTNARTLFVDANHTSASDSNSGVEDQPWKTIQKAARTVVAGDTVYMKKGTYRGEVQVNHSGDPNHYIVFSAYPGHGEKVLLDGSRFLIVNASFIKVSGLFILNTNNHGFAVRGPSDGLIISGNHT